MHLPHFLHCSPRPSLTLALASTKGQGSNCFFLCGGESPLQACMRATRGRTNNKAPIASPSHAPPRPSSPSLIARIIYHYEDPNCSLARAVLSLSFPSSSPPPPKTRLRRLPGTRLPSKKRGRRELAEYLRRGVADSTELEHFLFFGGFRFLGCVFFARFWRAEHVTLIWHQRGGGNQIFYDTPHTHSIDSTSQL